MLGAAPGAVTVPESRFRFNAAINLARRGVPAEAREVFQLLTSDSLFRLWGVDVPSDELDGEIDYRHAIETLIRAYAQLHRQTAPEVWIDHTPINVRYALVSHHHFPEAKFIHIVRDGRAVAASVLDLDWGPNSVPKAARHWLDRVALGLALETSAIGERVMRVRYEDLLFETEPTLRRLCEFCEVPFDPKMLQGGRFEVPRHTRRQHALVGSPPDVGRAQDWERKLSGRDVEIFESIAGDMLGYLGYSPRFGLKAKPMSDGEALQNAGREWYRTKLVNKHRRKKRLEEPPYRSESEEELRFNSLQRALGKLQGKRL